METYIREYGRKTWQMVREHLWIRQELDTKGSGWTTSNMVLEKKVGITVKLGTLDSSLRVKRTVKAGLNGKMEVTTKETS
jgi:hypothetical protein